MADKEPFGYQKPSLDDQELSQRIDRVDELVNQLLDDELQEANVRELESLLIDSPEARTQYVGMMQLHTDLIDYYRPQTAAAATSPILSHLSDSVDVLPPSAHPSKD